MVNDDFGAAAEVDDAINLRDTVGAVPCPDVNGIGAGTVEGRGIARHRGFVLGRDRVAIGNLRVMLPKMQRVGAGRGVIPFALPLDMPVGVVEDAFLCLITEGAQGNDGRADAPKQIGKEVELVDVAHVFDDIESQWALCVPDAGVFVIGPSVAAGRVDDFAAEEAFGLTPDGAGDHDVTEDGPHNFGIWVNTHALADSGRDGGFEVVVKGRRCECFAPAVRGDGLRVRGDPFVECRRHVGGEARRCVPDRSARTEQRARQE